MSNNKKRQSFRLLLVTLLFSSLISIKNAYAYPGFLTLFDAKYPAADTDNTGCQTCHEGAGGGSP
jgi:hypothetical protein